MEQLVVALEAAADHQLERTASRWPVERWRAELQHSPPHRSSATKALVRAAESMWASLIEDRPRNLVQMDGNGLMHRLRPESLK